jgi:hypothetical protein
MDVRAKMAYQRLENETIGCKGVRVDSAFEAAAFPKLPIDVVIQGKACEQKSASDCQGKDDEKLPFCRVVDWKGFYKLYQTYKSEGVKEAKGGRPFTDGVDP